MIEKKKIGFMSSFLLLLLLLITTPPPSTRKRKRKGKTEKQKKKRKRKKIEVAALPHKHRLRLPLLAGSSCLLRLRSAQVGSVAIGAHTPARVVVWVGHKVGRHNVLHELKVPLIGRSGRKGRNRLHLLDGLLSSLSCRGLDVLSLVHNRLHALLMGDGGNSLHLVSGLLNLLTRCGLELLGLFHDKLHLHAIFRGSGINCLHLGGVLDGLSWNLELIPELTDLSFVLVNPLKTQQKLLLVELTLLLVDLELMFISGLLLFQLSMLLFHLVPFNTKKIFLILEALLSSKHLLLAGMYRCLASVPSHRGH